MTLYCLQDPKGKLIEGCVAATRSDAWGNAFGYICQTVPGFEERYWKKWDASRRAARRLGWIVVPCNLVPK